MALLKVIPSDSEIITLIGGKKWKYEYKYRRGGKTLCELYARLDCFGFMIIFGKDEREKVEIIRNRLSDRTVKIYEEAETYHDGKWVMFDSTVPIEEIIILLNIKRKPNKKIDKPNNK